MKRLKSKNDSLKPNKLTRREKYYLQFEEGDTPHSLKLTNDFVESLSNNARILDIGCGFGRITNNLADISDKITVTGVDINLKEIEWAKSNCSNPNVIFEVMDGTKLDFQDNSFDHVVMVGMIGIVEPYIRAKLLKQAYRVVKPGGTVAVSEFIMNDKSSEQKKKYMEDIKETGEYGTRVVRNDKGEILWIATHFTKIKLVEMLSHAGLASIQIREDFVTSAAFKGAEVKTRRQYTAWGVKL